MDTTDRKLRRWTVAVFAVLSLTQGVAVALEQPEYEIVSSDGDFEVRRYAAMILAETRVESNFERAGNEAFRRLFGYISGDNTAQSKIAMTAPVVQQPSAEKIAMTAPVLQAGGQSGWSVAFVLPAQYSLQTAPRPNDPRVTLRLVPERTMAALRFTGTWDEDRFASRRDELRSRLAAHGLQPIGEAIYARYNPPFTPWFLRRNEVMIPVRPVVN